MTWTPQERRFLRTLNTPEKIQNYVDALVYNPLDNCRSPRYVMITKEGHCLEGGLLAAAALELHGHRPLMVDLVAHRDDHHVITVYKGPHGWGSISKSNTTLLAGRQPFYQTVRELVMSYFDFYFNVKGQRSLQSYSSPINLNRYNSWNWRTTESDLLELGYKFCELPHTDIISVRSLNKMNKVPKRLSEACFLGADPAGLYKP